MYRNGEGPRCRPGGGRGSVVVLVLMLMPVLLLLSGLVLDMGTLFMARRSVYAAADMGALAGAEDLDLEQLAAGVRYLQPGPARRDAALWVRQNLEAAFGDRASLAVVKVRVYNASSDHPLYDAVSGRRLTDPTVCVVVEMPVEFRFLAPVIDRTTVRVHSDASVLRKK